MFFAITLARITVMYVANVIICLDIKNTQNLLSEIQFLTFHISLSGGFIQKLSSCQNAALSGKDLCA